MRGLIKTVSYFFLWFVMIILTLGVLGAFGFAIVQLTYNDVGSFGKFLGLSVLIFLADVIFYSLMRQLRFKKHSKYAEGAPVYTKNYDYDAFSKNLDDNFDGNNNEDVDDIDDLSDSSTGIDASSHRNDHNLFD